VIDLIKCVAYEGPSRLIPYEELIPRVSVYGIIIKDDKVLLELLTNGKYHFIGGGLESHETPDEAFLREGKEETGLILKLGGVVGYHKNFFYFNPLKQAYANLGLYHKATVVSGELRDRPVIDDSIVKTTWVKLLAIHSGMFQFPEEYQMFDLAMESYYRDLRAAV